MANEIMFNLIYYWVNLNMLLKHI